MIRISAKKNDGLDLLVELLKKMFFMGRYLMMTKSVLQVPAIKKPS